MLISYYCTTLCYSSVSSVKNINLTSKGKTVLSHAARLIFCTLCQIDIYFKRLVIYQRGITMNVRNT